MSTETPPRLDDAVWMHLTFEGDDPGFSVVEAEATFALSELFEVRILVQHSHPDLGMRALLRRPVVLHCEREAFVQKIEGIVRRARAVTIEPTGLSRYELLLVPPMWLLTRRRNHRIFRGLSVPQIVSTILLDHPEAHAKAAASLENPHPPRDYTVQYGEDDAHAVFRLLADEGIATLFAIANGSELTMIDTTTTQAPVLPAPLAYWPSGTAKPPTPHVIAFEPETAIGTRNAAIRDYDYENPAFIIEGKASVRGAEFDADLEHYEYEVGEVSDDRQAGVRAQTTLLAESRARALATCRTSDLVAPGTRFSIIGSPRHEAEGELLVVSSRSHWTTGATRPGGLHPEARPEVRHDLVCMSNANPFKPRRLDKPRIAGVQTGLVVGAAGKEIDVDAEGRVEVEFRWDRRDLHGPGASRRVRVSQGWAGVGYGLVTHPRVSDEVIVAYLDGDPDQPIIVGRVHNPVRPSPLTLPGDETVSTWRSRSSPGGDGYNEILMDDLAGKERLEIHAQLDFKQTVERDASSSVGRNFDMQVKGDTHTNVVGASTHSVGTTSTFVVPEFFAYASSILTLNGSKTNMHAAFRNDEIEATYVVNAGNEYHGVGGVMQVSGPHFNVFADAAIHLQVAGATIDLDPGQIKLSLGGSSITITGGDIVIVSPMIHLNP